MRQSTEGTGMTLQAFDAALDRWGGAIEAWPAAERAAAERLLAIDRTAMLHLKAARQVDGAIEALMQSEAGDRSPVIRLRPVARAQSVTSWRRLATWGSVAIAASLAIGFAAGVALPAPDDEDAAGQVFAAVQDSAVGDSASDSGDYL